MRFGLRVGAALTAVAFVAAACGGDSDGAATSTTTTVTAGTTAADPATASAGELCKEAVPDPAPPVVASGQVTEASGVAASGQHDGLVWTHNDSGGGAEVHLVGADGADLGAWQLIRVLALDWEDMAIGPGPDGEDHLYVADIGDNLTFRGNVRVHRMPEPTDVSAPTPLEVETITLSYPDGPHDAESFFVDPISGEAHIVTKLADGSNPSVYRAAVPSDVSETVEMELAGEIDLSGVDSRSERAADDPVGTTVASSAAISADGTLIAVRTYNDVLLWDRDPAVSVFDAMSQPPCVALSAVEQQGEAVTVLPDGAGYMTISEGENPAINRFELPA